MLNLLKFYIYFIAIIFNFVSNDKRCYNYYSYTYKSNLNSGRWITRNYFPILNFFHFNFIFISY